MLISGETIEFQAFLVQVVAIGDLPVQTHLPGRQAFAAEHEGLFHGQEFALVMIRRLATGEIVVLGEVPEDVALVERAARRLIG